MKIYKILKFQLYLNIDFYIFNSILKNNKKLYLIIYVISFIFIVFLLWIRDHYSEIVVYSNIRSVQQKNKIFYEIKNNYERTLIV